MVWVSGSVEEGRGGGSCCCFFGPTGEKVSSVMSPHIVIPLHTTHFVYLTDETQPYKGLVVGVTCILLFKKGAGGVDRRVNITTNRSRNSL